MDKLDSDTHIETAEGIDLALPLANPVQRFYAFAIDFIIRIIIIWLVAVIFFVAFDSGATAQGLFLIVLFVVWWGYYVLFEMLMNGQSPGKRAMSLRVVNEDFTPIRFTGSLTRNLLRTADLLPGFYGFGVIALLFTKNNQRIGDIAGKTLVVTTQKKYFRDLHIQSTALPPMIAFSEQEQRAVIDFARYYETGATERAHEIAWHLRETLEEPDVNRLASKLRANAKWFLGERD